MKRKSFIILFVVAALAFTFVPAKSFAAISPGWHYVTIDQGGPFFDQILIKVKSAPPNTTTFQNQWLQLNPLMKNQLFATALSAISMQMTVRVWVYAQLPNENVAGIPTQRCAALWLFNE